jgi:hypothetical protein
MAATDHIRMLRLIFIVQNALVAVLGGVGLALSQPASALDTHPVVTVLGLHQSPLHSLILLIAGVLGVVMTVIRRLAGIWAALQFAGFAVLFNYGAAEPASLGLDVGSHLLHLVLVTIAATLGLMIAAPHMGGEH